MAIQEMFKEGVELRNDGKLNDAISKFKSIINIYPSDPKISGVYATLAGVYSDFGDYINARICFSKASELNPKSELASLGLYISLVELGEDEEAIMELGRYLENNPVNLYKTTLLELMEGLEKGYMTSYASLIKSLATKNGLI